MEEFKTQLGDLVDQALAEGMSQEDIASILREAADSVGGEPAEYEELPDAQPELDPRDKYRKGD